MEDPIRLHQVSSYSSPPPGQLFLPLFRAAVIARQGNQLTQLQKMITMGVKIDNRQFEQKLKKKGAYFFGKGYQDWKGHKKDKYGMIPIENDATEKRKPFKKETQKCYNCGKVGHLAKNCKSKKQVNATQEDKRKKKKPRKKEKELNTTQIKEKPDHATLS